MSINHFSKSEQVQEARFYFSPYTMDPSNFISHLVPKTAANFTNNAGDEMIPKEALFEKPLTPSDVGKLNRLVIPKQHAEKYFPLSGGGDAGEKGFLLSFEDDTGKTWRFRYSYWNSSQSYVLTKGWSRFVKEKRLDAGDFVQFSRHRMDSGRLFIGSRRRQLESGGAQLPAPAGGGYYQYHPCINPYLPQGTNSSNYLPYMHPADYNHHHSAVAGDSSAKDRGAGGNSKKLRLFGVNLEFEAGADDEHEMSGSTSTATHHHYHNPYLHNYSNQYQNHPNIKFPWGADGNGHG